MPRQESSQDRRERGQWQLFIYTARTAGGQGGQSLWLPCLEPTLDGVSPPFSSSASESRAPAPGAKLCEPHDLKRPIGRLLPLERLTRARLYRVGRAPPPSPPPPRPWRRAAVRGRRRPAQRCRCPRRAARRPLSPRQEQEAHRRRPFHEEHRRWADQDAVDVGVLPEERPGNGRQRLFIPLVPRRGPADPGHRFPFARRGSTVSGRQRKLRTPLSLTESPSRVTNTTASPSTCCSSPGLGGMASTTAIALRSSLRHAASLDVPVRAKLSGTDDDGANHCSHITHAHSARAVAVEVSREYAMSNGLRGSRMIQLPLLCISRRAASGRHLRRVLTGRCRVGLAHLILRNRCADGGARAGVRWPARMGLVGRDSQPKIAILQQGLFRIERLSDRGILSTLVALGTPGHGGMIAPMGRMPASR